MIDFVAGRNRAYHTGDLVAIETFFIRHGVLVPSAIVPAWGFIYAAIKFIAPNQRSEGSKYDVYVPDEYRGYCWSSLADRADL